MSEPEPFDPYAPPREQDPGAAPMGFAVAPKGGKVSIKKARKRLAAHLADSVAVAADRAAAGPRVRVVTWVVVGLAGASLSIAAINVDRTSGPGFILGIVLFGVLALVGTILLIMDLTLQQRGMPGTPDKTLKSFSRALATGRYGHAWATLAPTARDEIVSAPLLGVLPQATGEYGLGSPEGMKGYSTTFCRPSGGTLRQLAVTQVQVVSIEDDVAVVPCKMTFQTWPQWVMILVAVGFAVFRPAGIVGLVILFVIRKKHVVHADKTLLRGSDGAWYLLSGDILDGARGA
jgi:hypothetical protein